MPVETVRPVVRTCRIKIGMVTALKKIDSSAGRIQHGDAVRTVTEAKILQPVNCPNRFNSLNWINGLNRLNGSNRCNVVEAAVEG
jgi:hypothetical protein